MLLCGLCEERFPSNNELRVHLEGHASQLFDSSDQESEENGNKSERDSNQDSDEGSLVLDCVKEEEQLQDQKEEIQGEDSEERRLIPEIESSEIFMCSDKTNKRYFHDHMNQNHPDKVKCDHCPKRFSSECDLANHIRNEHEEVDSLKLPEDEYFHMTKNLDSDARSLILDCVKEEEQLRGQQEEIQGEDSERRTLHEKETSSHTFMCFKCSYKSISKKWFKHHMNQMHLNKHKCDHCPKRFPSKGFLANHVREKHMKDEDKPRLLEDEFLRITTKQQGNQKKRLHECLKCAFKHRGKSQIYQHIRAVHREDLAELYKSKGMVLDDAAYHKCTKCFFKTLTMGSLKQHIKAVHQKIRDYVCDLCKKAFSRKSVLMRHMKNIHISVAPSELHKCSICRFETMHKESLKMHLNAVHLKIQRFTCDLCQKKIAAKCSLRDHIERIHLGKKILSCNRGSNCSFRTTNKHDLARHIRRVHENIHGFSCEICGKCYSRRDGLSLHKKDHAMKDQDSDERSLVLDCVKEEEQLQDQQEEIQGEESERRTLHEKETSSDTFMCSKCSFKTINKITFKRHMNQMHLNKIKCEHCPNRFPSEAYLANHIREKHEDVDKSKLPEDEFFRITKNQGNPYRRLYECLECTFKTPGRTFIYQHIRAVHREDLDEFYKSKGMVLDDAAYHKCKECFFKTLYKFSLKVHIKTVHQKRRDFVCDLCKKAFSIKSHLRSHMKAIHILFNSSKLHKCSICSNKTFHKNQLKNHMNEVHLKIRKFTCDLCQMKMSRKSQIRQHMEKHHLEKNFLSCNHGSNCSFRTTDKRVLLGHIRRVHENIQGFSCKICGKWYSSRSGLSSHKKDHAMKGDQDTDEGSLVLDCVKEEEQLQGQQEETHGSEEFTSFASSSKNFMCSKCSFKTINKEWFKFHMNSMHLNKLKCYHCPKRYPTKGSLAYHIREKHVKDEEKRNLAEAKFFRVTTNKQTKNKKRLYACLKCTYRAEERSKIFVHIRSVHRELLDELYKSKGMVLDDIKYHKCTKCFFKTLKMDNLKQHIKTVHQKRRDFVCDLCKKAFSTKSHLTRHMKCIHISAEPSELDKCSICTYKSIVKSRSRSLHSKLVSKFASAI